MKRETIVDASLGLGVALLVTILLNWPLWQAIVVDNELTHPDVVAENDDELYYLARFREAADGHQGLGHPFAFEHRDQRFPLGHFPETIVGKVMQVTGLNIKTISIFLDFAAPLTLAFMLWLFVKPMLQNRRWRIALVLSVFFLGNALLWKRPWSPQLTWLLFLPYIGFLLNKNADTVRFRAARSTLIGFMFYTYPYHWTYCLVVEIFTILTASTVDWNWRSIAKRKAASLLPFILFVGAWLIAYKDVLATSAYQETLVRLGLIARHLPSDPPLQLIVIAVIGVLWFYEHKQKEKSCWPPILTTLLFANLVVLNQQLITGRELEFSSHYRPMIMLSIWLTVLWLLQQISQKRKGWEWPIWGICTAAIVALSIQPLQQSWALFVPPTLEVREETTALFTALNALPAEQVVAVPLAHSDKLAVYTSHYPLFAAPSGMHMLSDAELMQRAQVHQQLFPNDEVQPTAVIGKAHINEALRDRSVCIIKTILVLKKPDCSTDIQLSTRWQESESRPPLNQTELFASLQALHVSYILTNQLPTVLQGSAQRLEQIGDLTLYQLTLDR